MSVTIEISTKDRYPILLNCLRGIGNQTRPPEEILIFDDSEELKDLRKDQSFASIFKYFDKKKIRWQVLFGEKKGQVLNHQKALKQAKGDFIWRLDDDNIPESNVLENFLKTLENPKVGGVASYICHPELVLPEEVTSSKIEDCYFKYAAQFSKFSGKKPVDHFYSTFIYRKSCADDYNSNLSPVGHREETMFSHNIKKKGFDLIVDGDLCTWHIRQPKGGLRSYEGTGLWDHDENIFKNYLKENNINVNKYKLILSDGGIGDHFMIKHLLNEIKEKYKDHKIVIGASYPDAFEDVDGIEVISVGNLLIMLSVMGTDPSTLNPYHYGGKIQSLPMMEILRKIYL